MTTKTKNILLAIVLAAVAFAIYINAVLKALSE
jgi:hypothetical protein